MTTSNQPHDDSPPTTYGKWDVLRAELEGACPEHGDSLVWATGCDVEGCRNYGGKGRDKYER